MSTVRACTFVYPWDLAALGVEPALRAIREDGFDAIDLTACYHPVTTYSPGAAGLRLTSNDAGGVLFAARGERYGRIRPRLWSDRSVLAAWPAAAELGHELGLRVHAWMPILFQPWLIQDHPGAARVLPTGERVPTGACPSSPEVREFASTLVAEVASRFGVAMVQLEGVSFPSYDYHWPAARTLVEVPDWQRWLLGMCFCPSCVASAERAGIAAERLRRRILQEIADVWEGRRTAPVGDVPMLHAERCEADEEYAGYAAMLEQAPVDLVRQIAGQLKVAAPGAELAIWGPLDADGTPWAAERAADVAMALQAVCETMRPGAAASARELATGRPGKLVRTVHWCGRPYGAPLGPTFEAGLRASVELGVDEVNIFNWAMLPRHLASQIVPMLRSIEDETRFASRHAEVEA